MTAKEWRESNPRLDGNIRDYADVNQLVCLANMESLNAHFIEEKLSQSVRLQKLNQLCDKSNENFKYKYKTVGEKIKCSITKIKQYY